MPVLRMPYRLTSEQYKAVNELQKYEKRGEYTTLIRRLRELVSEDVHILSHTWVKLWVGKRWRNFFIVEACKEVKAVKVASRREKLAFVKLKINDERPHAQVSE